MSSGEMERHLLDLARKLEDLLMRLDGADSSADLDQLRDLAHEVAGTADLGFAALSVVARDFDAGIADASASVPRLADALTARRAPHSRNCRSSLRRSQSGPRERLRARVPRR